MPLRITLHVGNACNSKCAYCPLWCWQPLHPRPQQTLANIETVLAHLDRSTPAVRLRLIGGEPFAVCGLADFLRHQQHRATIEVFTNLTLPLPGHEFPRNVSFIVSIDAASREKYKRLRGLDSFDALIENLNRHRARVGFVNTVVCSQNCDQLEEIYQLASWTPEHHFSPVEPTSEAVFAQVFGPEPNWPIRRKILRGFYLTKSALRATAQFFSKHAADDRLNTFADFLAMHVSACKNSGMQPLVPLAMGNPGQLRCPVPLQEAAVEMDSQQRMVIPRYCKFKTRPPKRARPQETFENLIARYLSEAAVLRCTSFCADSCYANIPSFRSTMLRCLGPRPSHQPSLD